MRSRHPGGPRRASNAARPIRQLARHAVPHYTRASWQMGTKQQRSCHDIFRRANLQLQVRSLQHFADTS